MRILFLTSAHNSLSQRLLIELTERGHEIRVCVVATSEEMIAAASREAPELIIAPMLKIAIPEEVSSRHLCLIVHPGIKGDRGPSSIDWAITNMRRVGACRSWRRPPSSMRGRSGRRTSLPSTPILPRRAASIVAQVTEAAVRGVLEAISRIETGELKSGSWKPEKLSDALSYARGRLRPPMKQADRAVDWTRDDTATIIRKVRAADSAPGVLSTLLGTNCFLYGAHQEDRIKGPPGKVVARRDGAICIGTVDGAVWISHLKAKDDPKAHEEACHLAQSGVGCDLCDAEFCSVAGIKLPATQVLGPLLRGVPRLQCRSTRRLTIAPSGRSSIAEEGQVGYLSFDFYNGAMSTSQCYRLRDAFLHARSRPTRVIVLLGGPDFWSNGIHLNTIEASADPAEELWRNINAIDDLIYEMLNTMSHLVIAGLRGNAGAGGAMLGSAADRVYAMSGVVLNPHYRSMGELYGSEYWTYTLPRRVGQTRAMELTQACQPLGAQAAREMGFLDDAFGGDAKAFEAELRARAERLAQDPQFRTMLRKKHESRLDDENIKPLASYRAEELDRMKINFFGADPAYHEARRRFVFKGNPPPREVERRFPTQIGASHEVLGKAVARPMPEDVSWSALSPGANGSAHVPRLESDEGSALTGEAWGARLLGTLRRKVAGVQLRRDQ